MTDAAAGPVALPLGVEAFEKFAYLRMADRFSGLIDQQILFGDVGHILRVVILREKVVEGLILARADLLRNRQPPVFRVVEHGVDIEDYAPKGEQPVLDHLADRESCCGKRRHNY